MWVVKGESKSPAAPIRRAPGARQGVQPSPSGAERRGAGRGALAPPQGRRSLRGPRRPPQGSGAASSGQTPCGFHARICRAMESVSVDSSPCLLPHGGFHRDGNRPRALVSASDPRHEDALGDKFAGSCPAEKGWGFWWLEDRTRASSVCFQPRNPNAASEGQPAGQGRHFTPFPLMTARLQSRARLILSTGRAAWWSGSKGGPGRCSGSWSTSAMRTG